MSRWRYPGLQYAQAISESDVTKPVNQSNTEGQPLKMIEEPMVFQPIGVGMKKDDPALLAMVNETPAAMEKGGELTAMWNKWPGIGTEFKATRNDKGAALSQMKSTPLP